ncbi:MAG: BCCT family transporter, partial [Brachybacterium sp.]|nr:BCCT family transporter [Brachybacterium sp.]
YLVNLPELALWNDTFANTGWQNTWTVFYWAWTITWSPFVGIFIARISKGRTIRQFVAGVLAVPSAFSVIWFGIFGYSSFNIELNGEGGLIDRVVGDGDIPGALFAFLENYPGAYFISVIAIILVVIFFVTSVDSAALVTDSMANGHEDYNPLGQRIFWGLAIALVTAALLVFSGADGLTALQSTIILVGLPFFVMGWFQMYALLRALKEDAGELPQIRTREWAQVLPPEEYERREVGDEYDTDDYVVEPTFTSEVPVLTDPYEELELGDPDPESGTAPSHTGSGKADLPEDGQKL